MKKSKYYEAWVVHLKRGSYYRFKALAGKLKKAYESQGTSAFLVYNNPIHSGDNADVVILWSFSSYDEWLKDAGDKEPYEKLYGAGSWMNMLDEWTDVQLITSRKPESWLNKKSLVHDGKGRKAGFMSGCFI